jgi:putative transport protein
MAIQDVPMLNSDKIICSRLKRDELLMVPSPGTIIQVGDLLHLVGLPKDLHSAQLVMGQEVDTSLSTRGPTCALSVWSSPTKKSWETHSRSAFQRAL